ncbi:DUF4365 domain-containing protein [Polaromonas sp. P1(28)-8]|nr:DUF4365 domain-containing protein [Polaromonas sp. P1(28)-8]
MSPPGQLPQTGDSQDIGDDADTCFVARKPRDWRVQNLGGTDDYGLDYQVQTTPNQQATDVFRVQLKGTTSPKTNSTDEFISLQFKASTVRYYAHGGAFAIGDLRLERRSGKSGRLSAVLRLGAR